MGRTHIQVFTISKELTMYRYEIEVTDNGVTFFEDMWADNGKEAVDFGRMKYPYADNVELA